MNSTTRYIHTHKVYGLNQAIQIAAIDAPGPGGANHVYELDLIGGAPESGGVKTVIRFQNGPIQESGFNGLSNEALLAVVIDRLQSFQHERNADGSFNPNSRGKYACKENACALTHLQEGLMWLQSRTRAREQRGVEGTSAV